MVVQQIREVLHPLDERPQSYDPLMALIGDARFVLLGEASHGTHEFYQSRALITQRLITEKGFNAVAVEADWPDAYRVNRYVRGQGNDPDGQTALSDFKRFPAWMWRNADVLQFVEWLRAHNLRADQIIGAEQASFYGLDLYSLHTSIEEVLGYLDKSDHEAASQARERYAYFDHFRHHLEVYGYAASADTSVSCESAVQQQLQALQQLDADLPEHSDQEDRDELFFAVQNARLIKNAEAYYRAMLVSQADSWNRRDHHMAETLNALVDHLERQGEEAKIVVWAHNSHLGDARATGMAQEGKLNLGQLIREQRGKDACLIGFTTYHGSVTAASDWDAPAETKLVRPGLEGSYEALLHAVDVPRFLLPLRGSNASLRAALDEWRLERAIGVIYRPETERHSHYSHARLVQQFDAVLHFDRTEAVRPLEQEVRRDEEASETYPSGL